jgi:hypothetical protein
MTSLYLSTVVKAIATSKECPMVWLLYGLPNGTILQSPKTRGLLKTEVCLFIHTVLPNGTDRAFIHTVCLMAQSINKNTYTHKMLSSGHTSPIQKPSKGEIRELRND